MKYQYLSVPFQGQVTKDGDTGVANQLSQVINKKVDEGWEFVETANITNRVSAGCLGAILGQKDTYYQRDHIIFRKPLHENVSREEWEDNQNRSR